MMKRLSVGDVFHPEEHTNNPYTVMAVLKKGYVVKQKGDSNEEYNTKTIHDLFTSRDNPWVLKRKSLPVFTSANDDLFRV